MYQKVIRASAGTGKTYRLSIEFISLLLTYRELKFDEILVITFTKKATAEIRQKILEHLREMITNENSELWENIEKLPSDNPFQKDVNYLKSIYHEIVLNKNRLQISTIDSFINSIFSSIVAPYLRISDYNIDASINDNYLAELYETIFQSGNLLKVKDVFSDKSYKNVTKYENFINYIILKRWLFDKPFPNYSSNETEIKKQQYFNEYTQQIQEVFSLFFDYLDEYVSKKKFGQDWKQLFKKEFVETMDKLNSFSADTLIQLKENFYKLLSQREQLERILSANSNFMLDNENFWNGSKLLRQKDDLYLKEELLEKYQHAQQKLAEFLYWDKVIPEQEKIYQLAQIILQKYDEIKAREKIFTYDDISFYTYRLLYDESLSLIDNSQVLNFFYERLSGKFRFILIDEFQDTSLWQWKIVYPIIQELISGSGQAEYGGVCLVGDEKQSIYGWRGGKRELLLKAPDFLHCQNKQITISTSYRSKKIIVDFINDFFGNSNLHNRLKSADLHWQYDILESLFPDGYIEIYPSNRKKSEQTLEEQIADFVSQNLKPLFDSRKILPGNTAILARKNKQLDLFALALRSENIPYTQESSLSVFQQRAIAPLFFLLKFIAYHDLVELLKWFRSDLMRLPSVQLKRMMKQITTSSENISAFFSEQKLNPDWQNLAELITISQTQTVRKIIIACLEKFHIVQQFNTETDLKNMHRFLEIVGEFELNQAVYPHNLEGFIEFCSALEKKEEYTQLSHAETDAIHLMSFHKAKGLQFENVFVFIDLSGRSRSDEFHFYEQWDDEFSELTEIALTYNYSHVLKKCSIRHLWEKAEKQKQIEELNNLYVAFTRAKSNLWIFVSYESAKDYIAFLEDDKKAFSVTKELFHSFITFPQNEENYRFQHGTIWQNTETNKNIKLLEVLSTDFLELADRRILREAEDFKSKEFKNKFLIHNQQLNGTIVHYFLSFIKYDDHFYRNVARIRTINKFGTFISMEELENIFDSIHVFLNKYHDFFNLKNWDIIQTEYLLGFGAKTYRLDRLMVNEKKKQILILDYKIGDFYRQIQLDEYEEALKSLPFVREKGYEISSHFMEISLKNN
jgi:ATP-dependent exoDNAse (exonuclease V) beta subunit